MNREEKIIQIRKCIEANHYPLEFDPCSRRADNCYAYMLGASFHDTDSKGFIYNLGAISRIKYPPFSLSDAEEAFISDMDVLGIDCKKCSYERPLLPNEWKAVLFYDDQFSDSFDFHFIRQNIGGIWSHQEGIWGGVHSLKGNLQNVSELTFVGFFVLKVRK